MKKSFLLIVTLGLTGLIAACGSDTDEPGATDYDDFYVAEEGRGGEFDFTVEDEEMSVGDNSSFLVHARDRNGAPARNVFVECFSEAGLFFTESQGLTDDYGNFSGFVGCETVGSWRMQCSSGAAGWQEFKTIKCQ